jgi:uncharacterized protein YbjT (DUF2867 family)
MKILVTGITGAIGSDLAPRLLADGHEVRGLTRDPEVAAAAGTVPRDVELVRGDAVSGHGLRRALRGVDLAYYLIHSMEPVHNARFEEREIQAANNFALAAGANRAGVRRIIYLGGLAPPDTNVSAHMASRLRVERIVLGAAPEQLGLRASIVIGSRSRSFRFLVRLIERMPVLILPDWRDHVTTPVDQRDVTECLTRAATAQLPLGRRLDQPMGESYDLVGPDLVSYGELIERIRDHMLIDRPVLNLRGMALTPIASRISAVVAGEEHALIGPLMESLDTDLLPSRESATERLNVRQHSLDAAIEHALHEWELTEPLRAR